jgi:hypothetical protein
MQDELIEEAPEVEMEEVQTQEPVEQVDNQNQNWRDARRVMAEQKERLQQLESVIESMRKAPAEDNSSDEEILTKGEYKRLNADRERRLASQQIQTAEQIFAARNPDYQDLINKYLPKMVEKNPALLDVLKTNPQAHEMAYNLIKESAMYQKDSGKSKDDAKKILKNATQPVSVNAVGRGASRNEPNYTSMSNADIIALAKSRARGQAN